MDPGNAIVAVYRDMQTAQRAREELLRSGFDEDDVRVTTQELTSSSNASTVNDESANTHTNANEGVKGFLKSLFGMNDDEDRYRDDIGYYSRAVDGGNAIVSVSADSDVAAQQAQNILAQYEPVDIEGDMGGNNRADMSGVDTPDRYGAPLGTDGLPTNAHAMATDDDARALPVIEEELHVGKRAVQRGGVRVFSRVTERPVEQSVRLRDERAHIERRPANRAATDAELESFSEGTIEIHESSEEPVIEKTARVVEEVVVGKQITERDETVRDTVARTDVEVEEMGTADQSGATERNTNAPATRSRRKR